MQRFQPGEVVRVRADIGQIEDEFPNINGEMRRMGGRLFTIGMMTPRNGIYRVEESNWVWLDKWLEPVEAAPVDIPIPDLDGVL